jgi:alpha-D-ribose 1-methylphosphonate 5-triphosphate diphosphatase
MLEIAGGSVLTEEGFAPIRLSSEDGRLRLDRGSAKPGRRLDASGLLVLPGIIDIHGDAFERQIMPRPGVMVDLDVALMETDRQLVANGITTAYHGVTWSWEPGLRGAEMAEKTIDAIERLRPAFAADTRIHLRHETYNLDAEEKILEWLGADRIGCLAFNDHMEGTIKDRHRPDKMRNMVARSGMSEAEFLALVEEVYARGGAVPPSLKRLAQASVAADVPLLSHDDMSPAMRADFRAMGAAIAEFPINEPTAEAAAAAEDHIVFGAPNVLRGGSHTGCPTASEMVAKELCTVLASDYYYPALLLAPFILDKKGAAPLDKGWRLVSDGPARALSLSDRGRIAEGLRADVILVEHAAGRPPRIVATIAGGDVIHLSDAARLA